MMINVHNYDITLNCDQNKQKDDDDDEEGEH